MTLINDPTNSLCPPKRKLIPFSETMDLKLWMHLSSFCGELLASLMSFKIWTFLAGGFGVGNLSIPYEVLRVHHA
ncbi:hypothetical protein Leryth_000981 [Lithospermum erythrorhizon]|nr:hypothetical protein Leryth_000981 [Lithospermum erythrorhizon]